MKIDRWILRKLKKFFWEKFNPNWFKIQCIVGLIAGPIWCGFTIMDLLHAPYWSVSMNLIILNAVYFTGKFLIGFYILLESSRLLFCHFWLGFTEEGDDN